MNELRAIFDLHEFGTIRRPGPVVPITYWSRERLAQYPDGSLGINPRYYPNPPSMRRVRRV